MGFCFVCSGGVAAAEFHGWEGWKTGCPDVGNELASTFNLASARATGAGRHGATTTEREVGELSR